MENIVRNELKNLKIGIAQNNVKLKDFNTKVLYKKTPELDKDKSISISECMELIKKSNNKKVIISIKSIIKLIILLILIYPSQIHQP